MKSTGYPFSVPLKLLCEIFGIDEYIGKNKKWRIELNLEQDMTKLMEHIRPITDLEVVNNASAVFVIENPVIALNNYKIANTLAAQKLLAIQQHGNDPYYLSRFAHFESITTTVENQSTTTIALGNNKSSDTVPHAIIISVKNRFDAEHNNKLCLSARELAAEVIQTIEIFNFRRTFLNSPGDTITIDLRNPQHLRQLWLDHISFSNGGKSSTFDIKNISDLYDRENDSFIKSEDNF